MSDHTTDVVIIGGGIAGITLALHLPSDLHIILLTKQILGESNTRYAQGGLAASIGPHDSAESHLRDTLAAGANHCDPAAVSALVSEAYTAVTELLAAGTHFDTPTEKTGSGNVVTIGDTQLALGREAAHSVNRILHAMGDATGAEIERALVASVRTRPNITILEEAFVTDILIHDRQAAGIRYLSAEGLQHTITAQATILANGGAGRLWWRTSNPTGATADGLALAWRAGATLTDIEFTQFHPTVLVPPVSSSDVFLISEAVRGEGAYLRNQSGERFMLAYDGAELAPRDIVARAIAQEMQREGSKFAWLDLRHLDVGLLHQRFPTIATTCAEYGIDITKDPIPVAPAAHYFMGGVAVDLDARTSVKNLWAIGEVACTGVHGANRLASNSLLEGVVFGLRASRSIKKHLAGSTSQWPTSPRFKGTYLLDVQATLKRAANPEIREYMQRLMWLHAGLYRDASGLKVIARELRHIVENRSSQLPTTTVRDIVASMETANMLMVAQLITAAANARRESRGAHARRDYPQSEPTLAGHHFFLRLATDSDQPTELNIPESMPADYSLAGASHDRYGNGSSL
jgi:L-aspartate oxidase